MGIVSTAKNIDPATKAKLAKFARGVALAAIGAFAEKYADALTTLLGFFL